MRLLLRDPLRAVRFRVWGFRAEACEFRAPVWSVHGFWV